MAEAETVEEPEFRWGRKSGTGGKKKKIQFYESFTYDDVEYVRYDCVYLYEEGVQEPSVGKLIKMWETFDKKKKGKVLWFFQPSEISSFIGDEGMLENELFLASGEGSGLANINPLEAIAGKCNVVCISKDSRNRQPTHEEIANAEYVFRRTFDVGSCKIKDEMDETIAGTDVQLLLNREYAGGGCSTSKVDLERKEVSENAVQNNSSIVASVGNICKESEAVKSNGHYNDAATKEAADLNNLITKPESSTAKKTVCGPCGEQGDTAKANPANLKDLLTKPESSTAEKTTSGPCGEQHDTANANPANLNDLLTKPVSSTAEKTASGRCGEQRDTANANQTKEKVSSRKDLSRSNVEAKNSEKIKVKRAKESVELLDDRPSKKAKLSSDANGRETVVPTASAADEDEVKPPKDYPEVEKGPSKRLKRADKTTVVSNGKLPKLCTQQGQAEDHKKEGQQSEVTPKPDTDRSKWFGGLPWEDRIATAHEKGKLVLLQNLDPSYTSAEVEDIVRQGFKESCSAKMIQQNAFSSPHSGQAFVIFERKDVAKMVIERLDEGCLLLPNGSPLLGRIVTPCFPEKKPAFSGHLCIDKLRYQMQREQRDAVSTSHCSQPNTVEYDMALEWFLLQEKSDLEWKKLYEKQAQDLRMLKVQLKAR